MAAQYQSVVIIFSDGRKAVFTGSAVVSEKDQPLSIRSIKFTLPRDLPENVSFTFLEDILKGELNGD
jgi:hypothetical protein